MPKASHVLDRVLVLEMVRVTEAAAIAASALVGRGDEKAADAAAVEAMREALNALDMHGTVVSINADRAHADSGSGWVGIRPEKVLIAPAGEPIDAPGNHMTGAVVLDSSFMGVSTQYLVKMPWGQEILCHEQNTGRRGVLPRGTAVDVSWRPEFAFLLDASQDVDAGREED